MSEVVQHKRIIDQPHRLIRTHLLCHSSSTNCFFSGRKPSSKWRVVEWTKSPNEKNWWHKAFYFEKLFVHFFVLQCSFPHGLVVWWTRLLKLPTIFLRRCLFQPEPFVYFMRPPLWQPSTLHLLSDPPLGASTRIQSFQILLCAQPFRVLPHREAVKLSSSIQLHKNGNHQNQ